ncbi:hypothetical protein SLS58_010305 [Diplodia intermedia]|uniref:Uncharacterized protein n=1 Tax=Diplodia intermedia TaxID=856260 RepID=A0ABR3T7C4_9PEZI
MRALQECIGKINVRRDTPNFMELPKEVHGREIKKFRLMLSIEEVLVGSGINFTMDCGTTLQAGCSSCTVKQDKSNYLPRDETIPGDFGSGAFSCAKDQPGAYLALFLTILPAVKTAYFHTDNFQDYYNGLQGHQMSFLEVTCSSLGALFTAPCLQKIDIDSYTSPSMSLDILPTRTKITNIDLNTYHLEASFLSALVQASPRLTKEPLRYFDSYTSPANTFHLEASFLSALVRASPLLTNFIVSCGMPEQINNWLEPVCDAISKRASTIEILALLTTIREGHFDTSTLCATMWSQETPAAMALFADASQYRHKKAGYNRFCKDTQMLYNQAMENAASEADINNFIHSTSGTTSTLRRTSAPRQRTSCLGGADSPTMRTWGVGGMGGMQEGKAGGGPATKNFETTIGKP